MTTRFAALAAALVLLGASVAARAEEPSAGSLLAALQVRYDATRSVQLEFTERYVNRATGKTLTESGHLLAQKSGKMRWEYTAPEKKLFLLKGDLGWFYIPEEQVAYKLRAAGDDLRRLPSLFLAGKGDLSRDFTVERQPSESEVHLRLTPRKAGEEYDAVELVADSGTLAIRSLAVIDPIGNRTEYEFRGEQRDVPVPDGSFDFEVPRGVEVVEAAPERGSPRR